MAQGPDTLLRYVRGLATPAEADQASDAALLERFIAARDETAFAALVARYGPLVLQVCRRVLGDVHEAEDAFQAAFLVLARKAATVRRAEALPAWLHGVARRAALKARSARTRQLRDAGTLATLAADPHPDPATDLSVRELLLIIDEELERLPERYRLPVILCCLEGRSLEEAARQLGWSLGSVKGRLERGRARLHARLVRRGLTLSAVLAAAEMARGTATATVVTRLLVGIAQSAVAYATGRSAGVGAISAGAAALAGQTLRDMSAARHRIIVVLLLAAGLVAGGLIRLANSTPDPQPAEVPPALAGDGLPGAVPEDPNAPIEVSGRVVDPEGGPIEGAKLYVGLSGQRLPLDVQSGALTYPPRATTAADGRFHFTFTRSELNATYLDGSWPAVLAMADGYGPDWTAVRRSAGVAELNLKLVKDVPLDGCIRDHNGNPVAGATVFVSQIANASEEDLAGVLEEQTCMPFAQGWRGSFPGQSQRVKTGADGHFRLIGIGRDRILTLFVSGPGVPQTVTWAATRPRSAAGSPRQPPLATLNFVGPVCGRIRGVVRDKATRQPLAGVKLGAAPRGYMGNPWTALTDSTGRYEIFVPPEPGSWILRAQPQGSQPYFAATADVPAKPGPDATVADFDLVRGILVHGRVLDQATRQPPKEAVIEYYPLSPRPPNAEPGNQPRAASSCTIRPDGWYHLVVPPGPAVVSAAASPEDWYAVALVDDKELPSLVNDGTNHDLGRKLRFAVGESADAIAQISRFHVVVLINPGEGAKLPALDFIVQRARPIQGTVLGPDGTPLVGATVFGLTPRPREWMLDSPSFTIKGLNPRGIRTLFFYHQARGLGKRLIVRGDQAEPVTVQLEPMDAASVNGELNHAKQGGR